MKTYTAIHHKGTEQENKVLYEIGEDGTAYKKETPQKVREILEESRTQKKRIRIFYGDTKTGEEWGDVENCIVGRSYGGKISIPLAIKTRRSTGGGSILDDCIVRITETTKPNRVLYTVKA
jgi:hypothetical protein